MGPLTAAQSNTGVRGDACALVSCQGRGREFESRFPLQIQGVRRPLFPPATLSAQIGILRERSAFPQTRDDRLPRCMDRREQPSKESQQKRVTNTARNQGRRDRERKAHLAEARIVERRGLKTVEE